MAKFEEYANRYTRAALRRALGGQPQPAPEADLAGPRDAPHDQRQRGSPLVRSTATRWCVSSAGSYTPCGRMTSSFVPPRRAS